MQLDSTTTAGKVLAFHLKPHTSATASTQKLGELPGLWREHDCVRMALVGGGTAFRTQNHDTDTRDLYRDVRVRMLISRLLILDKYIHVWSYITIILH